MAREKSKKFEPGRRPPDWAVRFGRRLRELRENAGLTQERLAETLGCTTQDTITRIERGATAGINLSVLAAVLDFAFARGVRADDLLCGRRPLGQGANLPKEDLVWLASAPAAELGIALGRHILLQGLIEQHLRVADQPDERRGLVRAIDPRAFDRGPTHSILSPPMRPVKGAQSPPGRVLTLYEPGCRIVDAEQLPADWRGRYVPVLGRLSAGEGVDTVEAEEHPPGWATSYLIYTGAPAAGFALRVIGDSMEPDHRDGDMVVVDGSQPVRSGVCCVIYARNGDRVARLKRLRISKGKAHLESTNPNHPAVIVPAKTTEAFKVIAHLPALVATQARMPASLDRPFTGPLTGR